MASFAAAPTALLGFSARLCSLPRGPPRGPRATRCWGTKAGRRAVVPSAKMGSGAISRPGLRRGSRLLTWCRGAGRPGELYACADDGGREPFTTGVPSSFPESFYSVKDVKGLLKDLTEAMADELAVSVESVSEVNESAAVVSWHLELRGKSVPFTRGRTVYEYSRGPENGQLAFRIVNVTIDPWFNKRDPHLVMPEIVSWMPRISLYRNFLTPEECDYLIGVAGPSLESSLVVSKDSPQAYQSSVRTSYGMFLGAQEQANPVVQAIENRIAVFTHVPKENGEHIQVLRYEKGQHFTPHHDYFSNQSGNDRIATMVMYLNDDFEGGETYFPKVGDGECLCGGLVENGWSIKPGKGDAVFFWSLGFDGEMDPDTLHAGCDVISGEKWVAIKWLHGKKYNE